LARAIERCELGEVRRRLCGALSRGFAQRTGLAQAILHAPAVLLLDEPTAGLDPVQVHRFHELIAALRADSAILLSTHHLDEARRCCSRVAILHEGRVHATPADAPADALQQRFLAIALGREQADAA
jgi:ABC-2 type transport system ATP-binding protein